MIFAVKLQLVAAAAAAEASLLVAAVALLLQFDHVSTCDSQCHPFSKATKVSPQGKQQQQQQQQQEPLPPKPAGSYSCLVWPHDS
jgi:hypothetical protein